MTIVETPIAAIIGGHHRATGDGIHLVARNYRKGVRLDTHMHREAQLVYAARGTMQVTTPKGRWLVPPDRAVWVPAKLEHAIDVLADIEMRTLYFDLAWLKREERSESLKSEFVVRVSRLLHETILALFDGRDHSDRTSLLVRLAMLELHHAEDSDNLHSAAAGATLPARGRHRAWRPHGIARDRNAGARGRHLGADAVAAVFVGDAIELQELVPARAHCGCDRKTVDGGRCLGQAAGFRSRLCQRAGVLACLPAGHGQDADGVFGGEVRRVSAVTDIEPPPQKGLSLPAKAGNPVNASDYWMPRFRRA